MQQTASQQQAMDDSVLPPTSSTGGVLSPTSSSTTTGGILAPTSSGHVARTNCAFFRTAPPPDKLSIAQRLNPKVQQLLYPEVSEGDYGIPHIKAKPSLGVAMSGGGFRATTCASGWLRGLHNVRGREKEGGGEAEANTHTEAPLCVLVMCVSTKLQGLSMCACVCQCDLSSLPLP